MRFLCLPVSTILLATTCPAQTDDGAKLRAEEPAIRARAKRIDAELADLDRAKLKDGDWAKAWAGTYYTGDGLGVNVMIKVAPKAGLSYTWHGCLGLYDGNHGDIVETFPDGFRVKLALPTPGPYQYMSERFYFVRWGERRYLVPEAQMLKVVENFNQGGYARDAMYSIPLWYTERPRERSPQPAGQPQLPPQYAKLLLTKEIQLKVTSVTPRPAKPVTGEVKVVTAEVEFDAGTDQGVFKGMTFTYHGQPSSGSVEITEVNERTCKGKLTLFGSTPGEMVPPKIGTVLRYPEANPWEGLKKEQDPEK